MYGKRQKQKKLKRKEHKNNNFHIGIFVSKHIQVKLALIFNLN
jgi:hypothetical protein